MVEVAPNVKASQHWRELQLYVNPIMCEERLALIKDLLSRAGMLLAWLCQDSYQIPEVIRSNHMAAAHIFRDLLLEGTPFREVVVQNLCECIKKAGLDCHFLNLNAEEFTRLTGAELDSPEREEWLLLLKTRVVMEEATEESDK